MRKGNADTFLAPGSCVSCQGSLGQCFLLGFCNMMHTQISKPLFFPFFFFVPTSLLSKEEGNLGESGEITVLSFLGPGARNRRL